MAAYISEVDYDGGAADNFVEVAVDGGTDVSGYSLVVYKKDGTIDQTLNFGPVVNTIAGTDVYVFDDSDPNFPDIKNDEAIALVDDSGNVFQFISFKDTVTAVEGPANGTDSTPVGEHSGSQQSLQSNDGGASYFTASNSDPGTIPCYAPGTLIETPKGPRAVEGLRVGDLVTTVDHGPQTIRWVRRGNHPLERAEDNAKPVLIAAGALGSGRPIQDLVVSPHHRMFVGGKGQLDGWFKTEAFAPAQSLTGLRGIRNMNGKQSITWIHFACDHHEVVIANGCLSESLLLGPMVTNGLTRTERKALTDIYGPAPPGCDALNGLAARECLKVGEVRRHLAKCQKEKAQRTAKEIRKWDRDLAMEEFEAAHLREAGSAPKTLDLSLAS